MKPHPARPCKLRHSQAWGASVPNLTVQKNDLLAITTRTGKTIRASVKEVIYRGTDSTIVSVTHILKEPQQ